MSAPRRILMTTDAVGGVWTYAIDLAEALTGLGCEVTLVVIGPSPTPEAAAAVPGIRLIDSRLPLDWMAGGPDDVLEAAGALRGLARSLRPDVIHLNSPALAGGGFDAPVLGACHSCLATWWGEVKSGPLPEDFRWRTQALRRGYAACDALLAPSAAFAEATARTYDLPRPHVVRNGRRHAALRARREAVVFASGRLWDEGKNVAALDAAAAGIAAPVWAAGPLSGPNGAAAPPLHHARPLGPLAPDGVRVWLARATVYASAALYEPFGLGVLEAAQAGCALALSDIPTHRELWSGAAVFFDPGDPAALARACNRLLADPAEAARLGARARRRAGRYRVERMAAATAALYARMLSAPAPEREAAA